MRDILKKRIAEALAKAGVARAGDILIEHPADLGNGDYSTSVALKYAKDLKMSPRALAEKIVASIGAIPGVAKIEVAGAGFINFYLDAAELAQAVEDARTEDMWGSGTSWSGKRVMVEYTDPNPFKEFHIGHLVPNALGEAISRLFQFAGADVRRANWQGDVGVHVAKTLFILLEKKITNPTIADLSAAYPEGSRRYEEDKEAKAAIDTLNKTIYQRSDPRVNDLYDKGRKLSLEQFEKIYNILGTKFDYYFFESQGGPRGIEVVHAHPEIFPESNGAIIFPGEQYGLHTRVFINRAGLPTYEAKEIGLAILKREAFDFDLTLTITGNEQAEYFKVVMKAMELALPDLRGKLAYKTNGMLRFSEGKMSSRAGNIVRGEDLINDLREAARVRAASSRADNINQLAQDIAVAAIKYQILKQASGKDIIFDRERALSLEGDSGPYLQYAHARASAIVEKAKEQGVVASSDALEPNDLSRLLHRFPEVVEYAATSMEPHLLTTYALELTSAFNRWYAQVHILDGSPEASGKVALAEAIHHTLKKALWLLGMPAPEKM